VSEQQGQVLYDYVLGLYDFLERLNTRYPDILIEGCSGGGGRFDAGMLYYTPQIWCSDNTDAIDRLRIQYGTSFGYPVSAVGSHVSAVPNHQTGRSVPLNTRAVVAMSGTFGYELNLTQMDADEKQVVAQQVKTYKELAPLLLDGRYYRLSSPFTDTVAAWQMVSENQKEVLFHAVLLAIHGNMPPEYVRLKGLKEHAQYKDVDSGRVYPSDLLMEIGIPIDAGNEEYQAYQIHLQIQEQ
jgi:alpha-galactosidase